MSDFIVEAIQAAMKATATQAAETVQVAQPPDAALVEKFNEIMATADIRPENQIVCGSSLRLKYGGNVLLHVFPEIPLAGTENGGKGFIPRPDFLLVQFRGH